MVQTNHNPRSAQIRTPEKRLTPPTYLEMRCFTSDEVLGGVTVWHESESTVLSVLIYCSFLIERQQQRQAKKQHAEVQAPRIENSSIERQYQRQAEEQQAEAQAPVHAGMNFDWNKTICRSSSGSCRRRILAVPRRFYRVLGDGR